jgi:menaquinone-dependent protoporphyrinogen IX oxidase
MILVAYVMKYGAAAQIAESIASALTAEGKVAELQHVNAAGN